MDAFSVMKSELLDNISSVATHEGVFETAIPGLEIYRRDAPSAIVSHVHPARICLVSQGAKRIKLGGEVFEYDADHFLISSVDLPVEAQVTQASPERPYYGMSLTLDLARIAQIMAEYPHIASTLHRTQGMVVSNLDTPLVSVFMRLLDLQRSPNDIPALLPLVLHELYYRLLVGDQGALLHQMASACGSNNQIHRAVEWLKAHFDQPVLVPQLAEHVGMCPSAFHRQFRMVTAMTPIQFQKKLRLLEARRLMLVERLGAADAAFRVGYESPSQFTREYRRMFGEPPHRDICRML